MEVVSIKLSKTELEKLNKAWKRDEQSMNRSQFMKTAINTYAAETIFEMNQKETRTEA